MFCPRLEACQQGGAPVDRAAAGGRPQRAVRLAGIGHLSRSRVNANVLPLSRRISAERALSAAWFEMESCATILRDSASRMSCLMHRGVDGLTCRHSAGTKRSEEKRASLPTVPESVNSRRRSGQFATAMLQKVKSMSFVHHREGHCPEPSPADAAESPSDGDGVLRTRKRTSTLSQMSCASPGVGARVLSRKLINDA